MLFRAHFGLFGFEPVMPCGQVWMGTGANAHRLRARGCSRRISGSSLLCPAGMSGWEPGLTPTGSGAVVVLGAFRVRANYALRARFGWEPGLAPAGSGRGCSRRISGSSQLCPAGRVWMGTGLAPTGSGNYSQQLARIDVENVASNFRNKFLNTEICV